MDLPKSAHVAVVDGTQFLLFRNSGEPQTPQLDIVDTAAIGDSAAHNAGAGDNFKQHEEAGHAASVAAMLNHMVLTHKISELVVIADPRTLGEMRQHYHGQLTAILIGELSKTLTGHPVADIQKAVLAA